MLFRWLHNRRRKIFRFHDGRRVRCADPIEVAIGLAEHPTFMPDHLEDARWGNEDALEKVATAACDVFGVSPLSTDGKSGLTVGERLELMLAFDLYLLALKKNIGRSPTRPPYTVSTSPVSSGKTTSDTSGSGQTESVAPSAPPTSPGSESSPPPGRPSTDGT